MIKKLATKNLTRLVGFALTMWPVVVLLGKAYGIEIPVLPQSPESMAGSIAAGSAVLHQALPFANLPK